MTPDRERDSVGDGGERPFVGRARELDQILRALDDAVRGPGRSLLLMGEPGIGKTRLCDELGAHAAGRGLPVHWGRSWEAGGAPAYWPWLEILAGLARALDEAALRDVLGEGAPLVADLLPEIRARLPALAVTTAPPPEEARFRLWRTVVALVRRAAEPAGLVLVFDDLHAADRSSLLLLYALAREIRSTRVLLVATCRDVEARLDPEAGDLIARIGREGVTLGIARLDRGAAQDLLRRRHPSLEPDVEARIFERTQGNPLFLDEMLRLYDEEGPAVVAAGAIPAGVRDVIRQRLDRLDHESRALLDLAAVAGDEVDPALLAAAARRDPAWVGARLAEASRAGVLAERGGRLRFSHALVREILYRDLADDERRARHGAIGHALERSGAGAAPPLMELAHHAIEGPRADLERMVDFAERAARRAIDTTAPAEAIAVLERAQAAFEATGGAPLLGAHLSLALGEIRIRAGDADGGRTLCREVATLARSLGDAGLLARAALTYGRVFIFGETDPMLVGMLEEALEALPPGDSATRARLLARLGGALQPALVSEEPSSVAREAIATARRLGDRRVLLETMHDGLSALMDIVDPRERLALNLEVEGLALAEGDRERRLRTHARLAIDYLALGQLEQADARIDALEALAKELRAPFALWRVPLFRSLRATMHGRFADAERFAVEAADVGRRLRDPQIERALVMSKEGYLRAAERHDEMAAHDGAVRRERASYRNSIGWQSLGSAILFARIEDAERARQELELLPEELRPPADNLFAQFSVGEPAAFAGSPELVERLHARLLPYADQYAMLGMTAMQWEGPVARLLAMLDARLGRWTEAWVRFDDAAARCERLGALPYLARIKYEHGRALLARGERGDPDRARPLLEEARRLAGQLGMAGLVRLADGRLHVAGDAATAASASASASPPAAGVAPAPRSEARESDGVIDGGSAAFGLALEGEYWTITTGPERAFRLKDSLGLQYLARLVAEPGREIHVLDLVSGGRGAADESAVDAGDAGELLDDEARAEYRRRLEDLRETLAEAEAFGDAGRAARAREEIEFLAAELGRAVGLGGRARRAGGAAERARSAVQRRIKNALQRIGETDPDLERRLARAVKTGNFCVFRPTAG